MKSVELTKGVHWVGATDWAVRDFHGYETPHGTTYNNYLIMDDEITLVDTVKYDFSHITISNISRIVDPAKIRHVVINHIENDHATSIDKIMQLSPNATIHMTERGKKGLDRFYDTSEWDIRLVKTGDTLKIGKRTLLFIETPMLHWPDSMMTYCPEDKILYSQDAFGQHLASSGRFDDEFCETHCIEDLDNAVTDYYANILMPFGSLIKDKIAEIQKMGLDINIIAPDHGVMWRSHIPRVLDSYLGMATGKADLTVSIVYDTMWKSTELMTVPIAQGLRDEGIDYKILKLRATPMNVVITEFWKSRGTLIGTPTLNNIMFPSLAEFLTHLRGLRPKDRLVSSFGSFGWGGGGVKDIFAKVKEIGLETFEPGIGVNYKPSDKDEESCYEFGRKFAAQLKQYHAKFAS
ncbi:MAG TPA: FprA family A-type flavoprotein [Geobacteraceae bacterium]|nr:FprA family A-type flavoprotein [Geobacteraceae bacterium]